MKIRQLVFRTSVMLSLMAVASSAPAQRYLGGSVRKATVSATLKKG
jgi:hypothetical protein